MFSKRRGLPLGIVGIIVLFILLNLLLVGAARERRGRPRSTPTPPSPPTATSPSQTVFLGGDALPVPADIQQLERDEAAARPTGGQEPGWDRTSDFMVGSVAVPPNLAIWVLKIKIVVLVKVRSLVGYLKI